MIAQTRTWVATGLAAVLLALGAGGAAAAPAEAGFDGQVEAGMAGGERRLVRAGDAAPLFAAAAGAAVPSGDRAARALPSGQVGEDPPGGIPDG